MASTHIAAHPENARFMHVLRNIIGVMGLKISGTIEMLCCEKISIIDCKMHVIFLLEIIVRSFKI